MNKGLLRGINKRGEMVKFPTVIRYPEPTGDWDFGGTVGKESRGRTPSAVGPGTLVSLK